MKTNYILTHSLTVVSALCYIHDRSDYLLRLWTRMHCMVHNCRDLSALCTRHGYVSVSNSYRKNEVEHVMLRSHDMHFLLFSYSEEYLSTRQPTGL